MIALIRQIGFCSQVRLQTVLRAALAALFVMLTAMIGAIVLTLHHRPNVKRQSIEEQNSRNAKNVVEIKKVPFRTGV